MKKSSLIIMHILIIGCATSETNMDDPSKESGMISSENKTENLSPKPLDPTSSAHSLSQKQLLEKTMKEAFLQVDNNISCDQLKYSITKQSVAENSKITNIMRKDIYLHHNENNPSLIEKIAVIYSHLEGNTVKEVLVSQGTNFTYPPNTTSIHIYTASNRRIYNTKGFSLYIFAFNKYRKRNTDNTTWGSWVDVPSSKHEFYLARELDQGLETIPVVRHKFVSDNTKKSLTIEATISGENLDSKNPNYIIYKKKK